MVLGGMKIPCGFVSHLSHKTFKETLSHTKRGFFKLLLFMKEALKSVVYFFT
jgi:hypothetical protein